MNPEGSHAALKSMVEEEKADGRLVFCAVVALAAVSFIIRVFGFRGIRVFVQHVPAISAFRCEGWRQEAICVRNAISQALGFRLSPAMCLRRAAASATLLRLMGVSPSVVIGVQRFPFAAHAWTELDGYVVTEETGWTHDYEVIDRF
jgi:hypothetical protein